MRYIKNKIKDGTNLISLLIKRETTTNPDFEICVVIRSDTIQFNHLFNNNNSFNGKNKRNKITYEFDINPPRKKND